MKKAYQLSSLGVPLKHLGARKFTEFQWERLMAWYKSRRVKPRWELAKDPVKKPVKKKKVVEAIKERIVEIEAEDNKENISEENISDVKPNNNE